MMTLQTTALPKLRSSRVRELGWTAESDHYDAYVAILEAEEHVLGLVAEARNSERDTTEAEEKLVASRVAGYLFLEFEAQSDPNLFGATPSAELIKWLFTSSPGRPMDSQHDVIIACGAALRDNLIRLFRMPNVSHQLRTSSDVPRRSFDTLADMIHDSIDNARHVSPKRKVLARDGFRCVVTGTYDVPSAERCVELRSAGNVLATNLEVTPVLDLSIIRESGSSVHGDDPGLDLYKSSVFSYSPVAQKLALAILRSFGFSEIVDALTEPGVCEATNLLSLQHNPYSFFRRLDMWFERTDEPHRYKVCTFNELCENSIRLFFRDDRRSKAPIFVEFNSQCPQVPPPEPRLLALHATCARVAQMSGAADLFDKLEWDAEE